MPVALAIVTRLRGVRPGEDMLSEPFGVEVLPLMRRLPFPLHGAL